MIREQRRLAAIVSADVAGYSRLMGRDDGAPSEASQGTCRACVSVARGKGYLSSQMSSKR